MDANQPTGITYQIRYGKHSFISKWLAEAHATGRFKNFIRNVSFWAGYDEHSFAGKLVNHHTWSDKEYLKLEQGLIELREAYPYPVNIPRDVFFGVFDITRIIMVPDYNQLNVVEDVFNEDFDMYERRERLFVIVESLYFGERLEKLYE